MADVEWIKLKVGMFDGDSFKKIKRAKIGGEKFRDKLTAIWFELLDLAGRCNHGGAFINSNEIPYKTIEDIATQIDRETEELELCMSFYINEGMVEMSSDTYLISKWLEYQNTEGLDKIREQKRISQAKWRANRKALLAGENVENVDATVDSTGTSTEHLPSISISTSNSEESSSNKDISYEEIKNLYNSICASFPRCKVLSDARKKAIRARFKSGYTIEDFRELFTKAEASGFLKGRNDRNWTATLDWLITDANMAKVLSGNYDNRPQMNGYAQPPQRGGYQNGNVFLDMLNERRGNGDV